MRKLASLSVLVLVGVMLAGCPRAVRKPEAPGAAPPPADTRGAALYEVSSEQSEALVYVYKGGALSRLGHNHIMASRSLSGRLWLHPTFSKSGFEITLPVGSLIVDDPQLRSAAGEEFASEVTESDKAGTRKNMLRAEVLDSEHYPHVLVRSTRIAGTIDAPAVTARVTIRDAARDLEVPTTIRREGEKLIASGEFDVRQTDFGMKPFSVALGALEVQDRLHIEFRIVALRKN